MNEQRNKQKTRTIERTKNKNKKNTNEQTQTYQSNQPTYLLSVFYSHILLYSYLMFRVRSNIKIVYPRIDHIMFILNLFCRKLLALESVSGTNWY